MVLIKITIIFEKYRLLNFAFLFRIFSNQFFCLCITLIYERKKKKEKKIEWNNKKKCAFVVYLENEINRCYYKIGSQKWFVNAIAQNWDGFVVYNDNNTRRLPLFSMIHINFPSLDTSKFSLIINRLQCGQPHNL